MLWVSQIVNITGASVTTYNTAVINNCVIIISATANVVQVVDLGLLLKRVTCGYRVSMARNAESCLRANVLWLLPVAA